MLKNIIYFGLKNALVNDVITRPLKSDSVYTLILSAIASARLYLENRRSLHYMYI